MIKPLTPIEANDRVLTVGLKISAWNQVVRISNSDADRDDRTSHQAPTDARKLYCFSQYVAGWVPDGAWKVFQIDNSTYLDAAMAAIVGRLLFGSSEVPDLARPENRSFLFEFGSDKDANESAELVLSSLIFFFLLFECSGQIVSSSSGNGRYVDIQDGLAHLVFGQGSKDAARAWLDELERSQWMSPQWVLNIIADRQERAIRGDTEGNLR